MKIAFYTSAIAHHVSGGIAYIIHVLNELSKMGYEVYCFVDDPPFDSQWLKADFPIISSKEIEEYDGILISPYSPTAKKTSEMINAQDRFYNVHTLENAFCHNGRQWMQQAEDSYKLPLKIFCTSSYVEAVMKFIYKRNTIGTIVPPGVDFNIFNYKVRQPSNVLRVGILARQEFVRGTDTGIAAIHRAMNKTNNIEPVIIPPSVYDRHIMAQYFQNIDIFISADRLAGSPLTSREAMACAAIPIVSPYGNHDIILNDYNGWIVASDNISLLTEKIIEVANMDVEQRKEISDNAAVSISKYTWEYTAKCLVRAISEGIERGDELLKPSKLSLL